MDGKRYTPADLESNNKQEVVNTRKSQQKLAKQLRTYHLSCKEISEVTGLAMQEVKQLI